jgi:hypothetical protein
MLVVNIRLIQKAGLYRVCVLKYFAVKYLHTSKKVILKAPTVYIIFNSTTKPLASLLKGYCHEFNDSYNGIQVVHLKNLGLPNTSEEFRIAGAYFYSLSCCNSKKSCCGGFSFDSHTANDE